MQDNNRSEIVMLAEAMNNLAAALRESNQLMREMQLPAEYKILLETINELSHRISVLSARIR